MSPVHDSGSSAVPVLTIDGPSGSGKGTVAQTVAQKLGWNRLDSGALYRAVGLAAERAGIPADDVKALTGLTANLNLAFETATGTESVRLDGEDVTDAIRSEEAGRMASQVASLPAVREALMDLQRGFAAPPGLVADGRDMGTVVFPGATLKVFLTASPEARAERRHKQLIEKGIDVSLPDLSKAIADRDRRDASRSVAPLRPAEDARLLDSTKLGPAEVVEQVLSWLGKQGFRAG